MARHFPVSGARSVRKPGNRVCWVSSGEEYDRKQGGGFCPVSVAQARSQVLRCTQTRTCYLFEQRTKSRMWFPKGMLRNNGE